MNVPILYLCTSMEQYFELGYFGLFLISFLAATILPLGSEGFFLLMIFGPFDAFTCLVVASAGNWLGGLTNYFLGSLGKMDLLHKWFKISEASILKMEVRVKKYGSWSALLCWLPFIGDPLAVALGFFRVQFWTVAILMLVGKTARYAFLIWPLFY